MIAIPTDLIPWLRSLDVWPIVALLLVVQLFVEMRHGRRVTQKQLMEARMAGYEIASRQTRESQEISRENIAAEEAALKTYVAAAIARRRLRHRLYFYQLPGFIKARACDKGLDV